MRKQLPRKKQPKAIRNQTPWKAKEIIEPPALSIDESDPSEIQILKEITIKMRSGCGLVGISKTQLEEVIWNETANGRTFPEKLAN